MNAVEATPDDGPHGLVTSMAFEPLNNAEPYASIELVEAELLC